MTFVPGLNPSWHGAIKTGAPYLVKQLTRIVSIVAEETNVFNHVLGGTSRCSRSVVSSALRGQIVLPSGAQTDLTQVRQKKGRRRQKGAGALKGAGASKGAVR